MASCNAAQVGRDATAAGRLQQQAFGSEAVAGGIQGEIVQPGIEGP